MTLVNYSKGLTNAKVSNINPTLSELDNYVEIDSPNNTIRINQHMSTAKVAKLVDLIVEGDSEKLKKIIRADVDPYLSRRLIQKNNFDFDFYIEIFQDYLTKFDMYSEEHDVYEYSELFKSLVIKSTNRLQYTKFEEEALNCLGNGACSTMVSTILEFININRDCIPTSRDFTEED